MKWSRKPRGSARIRPDQKWKCLRDCLRFFNKIAQNSKGYRYTIPQ
jgi:hypothetical protein